MVFSMLVKVSHHDIRELAFTEEENQDVKLLPNTTKISATVERFTFEMSSNGQEITAK